MLLTKKQELIAGVLGRVRETLLALPDAEYFDAIKKLAVIHAEGEGTIRFSERDLSRLPEGFADELNAALGEKARLAVSGEPCRIDGGFLLSYGGIEENCSFDALFRANEEELQDLVQQILFSDENQG